MLSFPFQIVKINRGRLPLGSVRMPRLAKMIQHKASCVTRIRDHSLYMGPLNHCTPFIWYTFPARVTQN